MDYAEPPYDFLTQKKEYERWHLDRAMADAISFLKARGLTEMTRIERTPMYGNMQVLAITAVDKKKKTYFFEWSFDQLWMEQNERGSWDKAEDPRPRKPRRVLR